MGLMDKVEIVKRPMVVFFVIDTSGSMEGERIGELNRAMRELIPELKDSGSIDEVQLKIAVLGYSAGAKWLTDGPVAIERFTLPRLDTGGVTDFGAACKALNEKLSTTAFIPKGSYPPVIIATTDGEPTDDWKPCLAALKQNNWFKAALKLGIAIEEDASLDVLAEFTGRKELVVDSFDTKFIRKVIRSTLIYNDDCGAPVDAEDNKPRSSGSSVKEDVW